MKSNGSKRGRAKKNMCIRVSAQDYEVLKQLSAKSNKTVSLIACEFIVSVINNLRIVDHRV